MGDVTGKSTSRPVVLVSEDELRAAGIELINGKNRLLTSSIVTIEQLLGGDPQATTWLYLGTADDANAIGSAGDTIRVQIPAAVTPLDSLYPAVDVTYTVQSSDLTADSPETAVADGIVSALNGDSDFSKAWKAQRIKDFSGVFISSRIFNEWGERSSWTLTTTGTTTATQAFSDIVRRGFQTELSRSPNDPRRGVLAIAGTVNVQNQAVAGFSPKYLTNGGSDDMRVDGSVTPVDFTVTADSTQDFIITEVKLLAQDGNINLSRFMDSTITNGLEFTITSEGGTVTFPDIITTRDLLHIFTSNSEYTPIIATKAALFVFKPTNPFVLRAGSSDEVQMKVRDDLSGLVALGCSVEGFLIDA